MRKHLIPQKFIWVDLEMTGLDPKNCKITEVGIIITDANLNELEVYESLVHQPKEVIGSADAWVKENMNDLLAKSLAATDRKEDLVIGEVAEIIEKHFHDYAVLAGNSIHQDRRFIREHWGKVEEKLHYRMLDVSAWKVFMQARFKTNFSKPEEHRALADIRGSIEELSFYLDFFDNNKN